jgi:hypothetical protein
MYHQDYRIRPMRKEVGHKGARKEQLWREDEMEEW